MMRKTSIITQTILFAIVCVQTLPVWGQALSRSENTELRTGAAAGDIPCAGSLLFFEDFSSGISSGWTVIDGDTLSPQPQMQLQKGWQGRIDYRDSLNKLAVSPSWYLSAGKSDDWLISPAISVGTNSCLSWKSYSVDQYFLENYEVRVASTPDTTALLANSPLVVVSQQGAAPAFRAASLTAYANQTVHIAFRQTSFDKFVLALDDVSVSNVNALDIGVYAATYGSPNPGDTVRFIFEVANYGSDTITGFKAYWSVSGGPAKMKDITAVSLAPNKTVSFVHDSLYVSDSVHANYSLCTWTMLPNGQADQDASNDSLCKTLTIGTPVGAMPAWDSKAAVKVFPNPFSSDISLTIEGLGPPKIIGIAIYGMAGKKVFSDEIKFLDGVPVQLDLQDFPAGIYFLSLELAGEIPFKTKIMRR